MDSSRSSSTSSQHYAVLLNTVSELRNELEKAISKINSLEELNTNHANNYQLVKDELIQTRLKYNDAKESYLQSVSDKLESERRYESFIDKLKAQLAEKTAEFDLIRDKLIPHDLDQLRISVQEELEIQHKSKLRSLENEFELDRKQFFAIKRDYEKGKVEYEVLIQHQQHEIVAIRKEREDNENLLHETIRKLKEVEFIPSKDDKLRSQRANVVELTHLTELLREEVQSTLQERDEALFSIERMKSIHEESMVQIKARLAAADAEKKAWEENNHRILAENERKDALIRSLKQNIDSLTQQLSEAVRRAADLNKQCSTLKDDHNKMLEQLQSAFNVERSELQQQCDALSDSLNTKEEALRRSMRESADSSVRAESNVGEMRRAHQLQLQELRKKYTTTELGVAELKSALKTMDLNAIHSTEKNEMAMDALHSEIARSKRDNDAFQQKIKELEALIDTDRRKLGNIKQDSNVKEQALELKLRDANSMIVTLEAKYESNRVSLFDTQAALQAAKESYQKLEQRSKEALETTKHNYMSQIESIAPAYKESAEKLRRKTKETIQRERKRAEAYKIKALEAHSKVKLLSSALNNNNNNNNPTGHDYAMIGMNDNINNCNL